MNPLTVEVDAPLRPREIPETPEVYPAPRRAVMPPGSEIRFVVELCPGACEHAPGGTSPVRWQLQLGERSRAERGALSIAWPSS